MNYRIANIFFFYAGWFACVAGAIRNIPWIGPAVIALAVAIHLHGAADRFKELTFIAIVTVLGGIFDTLLVSARVYTVKSALLYPWLMPAWIFALWALLATTVHSCLSWLSGRYKLAAILGAISAPLSYLSGARMGALTLNPNTAYSLGSFAIAWGFAFPALVWFGDHFTGCRHGKAEAQPE